MSIPHSHKVEKVLEDWGVTFCAQHTFESFMHGGPKLLCVNTQYTNGENAQSTRSINAGTVQEQATRMSL